MPFKWYPGRARADAGVPLAAARPDGGGRAADRPRRRDEVPVLLRPPSEQGRLAPAPVPPGVRARPHRARPVLRVGRGPRDAPPRAAARPASHSARRASCSRPRERRRPARSARPGSTPRCSRTRRRSSPTAATRTSDFVLSVGRLDRAKRIDLLIEAAAKQDVDLRRRRGEGPDRERLERLAERTDGRVASPAASPTRSSPISTRAASPSSTRRSTRTSGWCPYEAFLSEKPVVTTTDAGGPLDVVLDRETGLVVEPTRATRSRACARDRRARRRANLGPGRQGARRAGHVGHARSTGCSA